MTYYTARSPASGSWMRAPFHGSSLDRNEAWPYPENHPWLEDMVTLALKHGYKMRLRQVMVVVNPTCVHGNYSYCGFCSGENKIA